MRARTAPQTTKTLPKKTTISPQRVGASKKNPFPRCAIGRRLIFASRVHSDGRLSGAHLHTKRLPQLEPTAKSPFSPTCLPAPVLNRPLLLSIPFVPDVQLCSVSSHVLPTASSPPASITRITESSRCEMYYRRRRRQRTMRCTYVRPLKNA